MPGAPRRSPVTTSRVVHLSDQGAGDGSGDVALVMRAIDGDKDALEHLLMKAQDLAWRFSMTVCGHPEDAEDAMQEALVRTYRHVPQLRDPEAFRPWLYRTVRNVCLMARRRRVDQPKHMLSLDELLPTPGTMTPMDLRPQGASPEEVVVNTRLRRRLSSALAQLPPPFRAVVFLREVEGLSTREVAQALGVSEDNVKTRLHRARLLLQRELTEWKPVADAAVSATRRPRASKPARKGARP